MVEVDKLHKQSREAREWWSTVVSLMRVGFSGTEDYKCFDCPRKLRRLERETRIDLIRES